MKLHKCFPALLNCVLGIQVALEVEREEDEGGMVGETFTDYVSNLFHMF